MPFRYIFVPILVWFTIYFLTISLAAFFVDNLSIQKIVETYFGGLISSFAIFTSTTVAACFAEVNIREARKTSKLQKTIDFINAAQLDEQYIEAKEAWKRYARIENGKSHEEPDDNDDMAELFAAFYRREIFSELDKKLRNKAYKDEKDRDKYSQIRGELLKFCEKENCDAAQCADRDGQLVMLYLNHFELASLAIKQDSLDDDFYHKWHGTLFISTWNASVSAIGALRSIKKAPNLYVEWKEQAQHWNHLRTHPIRLQKTPEYNTRQLATLAVEYYRDR